jgi:hypothetical protein
MFRGARRAEDGRINPSPPEEANEMLSTKIRNTAISLVAASSVALAVAPGTAIAQKNIPGRFQKSAEALKMSAVSCDNDFGRYNQLVDAGEELLREGKAGSDAAFGAAGKIRENAKKGGCGWAQ